MEKSIKNFINLTYDLFDKKKDIQLHPPYFDKLDIESVNKVIYDSNVSSIGPEVLTFEKKISTYVNCKYSSAIVNGTNALQVALKVIGVSQDSEVLTQSLTFVATSNAISYLSAEPVFIDVDIDTLGMSPSALKSFLDENGQKRNDGTYNKITGKKISACVPMHTFGFICRINDIIKICKEWDIPVIEDAAEALGSRINDCHAGTFGEMGILSFNGNKIITTGGGGMVLTNNKSFQKKIKHLSTTAKSSKDWEYIHDEIGYNFRMPNINAALGISQLDKLKSKIQKKKYLHELYKENLINTDFELLSPPSNQSWNYWLMALRLKSEEHKNLFLKQTNSLGIHTRPIWRLTHKLPMYKDCIKDSQKNSEILEKLIVNIPSYV